MTYTTSTTAAEGHATGMGASASGRTGRHARRSALPKAAAATGAACALALGGVMAYLTATDTETDRFELADSAAYAAGIAVSSDSWDATDSDGDGVPDAAEGFLPTQTISLDPRVVNASSIDSYAVAVVSVPTERVQLHGSSAPALTELFSYKVNAGWAEQGSGSYDAATGTTAHTYLCSSKLAAGASSAPVFSSVTLANLAPGQVAAGELAKDIVVTGHTIQALGFSSADEAYAALAGQLA